MKPWFKHYNNAHTKKTIKLFESNFGFHKGYSIYFRFVEYCHATWDGNVDHVFTLSWKDIQNQLGTKRKQSELVLSLFLVSFTIADLEIKEIITFRFPKLAEIQDKDSKYNRKRIASGSQITTLDKSKSKSKSKNKIKETNKENVEKAKIFLGKFNALANKSYRPVESTLRPIVSALDNGYTEDDLWKILQLKLQDDFWTKDNKKFISPITLYRKEKLEAKVEEVRQYERDNN